MRIQLGSDLHLEFLRRFPGHRVVEPAGDGVDVLVLAGDIGVGTEAIRVFADWPARHVLYVPGNHEFYDAPDWQRVRAELKLAAEGTRVMVLDDDAVVLDGVRFLGSTLWTDFGFPDSNREAAMARVEEALMDYRAIRTADGVLRAVDTLHAHRRSRAWLERALAAPFAGPTVVVSHHGPHPLSVHPRYAGSDVNAGFVSDLTPLLARADLWLHGHVHDSFDYRVEGCRVVANPAGYVLNRREALQPAEFRRENPAFDARLVLAVPQRPARPDRHRLGD